ncbi:restriction endonuclease subunit S [Pseudomonas sp. phDV1]|nr:restriction endonuclease subunit S [Pseudomonas sp. phDV1]AXO61267.1 restriction endonuclease subunit S [Pseudomonas sp. phDV1]
MTALLTDNLPLLAGAPNGIKKLRELILELAVRGKLVPQDPNDEPASELLKCIAEEKARLVEKGRSREQKSLQEIDEASVPYMAATGWAWIKLGDISLIERGGSPRPIKDFLTDDADGLNWIKIGDTDKGGKYITSAGEKIRRDGLVKTRMVYPGDFLLTNSMSFGRPYITQIEGCIHDGWLRISPPDSLVKDYLYLLLSSPYVRGFFAQAAAGAVVLNLNADKVRELPTPLPPLAEQHRIVAKVDELMALCDRLEARQADSDSAHTQLVQALLDSLTQARDAEDFAQSWQRLAEHFHTLFTTESSIDALKQTLLQLAVMGKLVPQVPSDEPASELLTRIAEERARLVAEGKLKKQKPLAEIDESEMSFELPLGWKWQRFADFALDVSTGPFGSLIHQSDYVNGGVPLVNPSHMIDGRIVADSSVSLSPDMAASLDSYRLSAGDIVMARRGEVGRAALVTEAEEGWLCGTGSFVLRFTSEISRAYVWILFRCHSVRTYLAGAAVGTTMVNLNHSILLKMPIAVPPITEQHRIVAKVDQLMVLCDQLKARLNQARQMHEQLANALVEQAVA